MHDGLKSQGCGNTKKIAKQNAARHMLDVLDGRAKAINDDVLESIDMGLKALRGGGDKDAGNSKHTNTKSGSSIKKETG